MCSTTYNVPREGRSVVYAVLAGTKLAGVVWYCYLRDQFDTNISVSKLLVTMKDKYEHKG